jgi:hypothetical protein
VLSIGEFFNLGTGDSYGFHDLELIGEAGGFSDEFAFFGLGLVGLVPVFFLFDFVIDPLVVLKVLAKELHFADDFVGGGLEGVRGRVEKFLWGRTLMGMPVT